MCFHLIYYLEISKTGKYLLQNTDNPQICCFGEKEEGSPSIHKRHEGAKIKIDILIKKNAKKWLNNNKLSCAAGLLSTEEANLQPTFQHKPATVLNTSPNKCAAEQ